MTIDQLLAENTERHHEKYSPFDPLTGAGAPGERVLFQLKDYLFPQQYIPVEMRREPLIDKLAECGSIEAFVRRYLSREMGEEVREKVIRQMIRLRIRHDFCFWAFAFVKIKPKSGGDIIPFKLNRAQRKLIAALEKMRLEGRPIRLILLKARQWGGSTAVQVYMAWIQLVHKTGWNSLIVAQVRDAALEVKGMFSTLIDNYPLWLLHEELEDFEPGEKKLTAFEGAQNIDIVPQRNCKIKVGSAEKPDSARGGDSALVHCTEVAFWVKTENKTPEQIVRSACSGVLFAPLTMEIYESTANGTGNYFHQEWERAKRGESDKEPLFVPWFDIEMYELPLADPYRFAQALYENRNNRANYGAYDWWLWERGATLEAINWYQHNRKRFDDHADMAAEYPSDDIEAFKHSGKKVFDQYKVEAFSKECRACRYMGDVYGLADQGPEALKRIKFCEDRQGLLKVWELPELEFKVVNRYLTVVDVGGRSSGADYSVVVVFDRYWMMEGDKPEVVAEWYGHIDHDLLAWKAAQIAAYYDDSLLVIESNTLETRDKERDTDGDHTSFILNQIADVYPNLYARRQSEEAINSGAPRKWGFHTNSSTKPMIIDHLIRMIREQAYIERERGCLDEYLCYEKKENGSFGAISGRHDDRLMTRAIGLFICFCEMDLPKIVQPMQPRVSRPISVATI